MAFFAWTICGFARVEKKRATKCKRGLMREKLFPCVKIGYQGAGNHTLHCGKSRTWVRNIMRYSKKGILSESCWKLPFSGHSDRAGGTLGRMIRRFRWVES